MIRVWWLIIGLVGSVVCDVVYVHHEHAAFWWHTLPGFDFAYGLTGASILVLLAKWLGHHWLERPPDFYEEHSS